MSKRKKARRKKENNVYPNDISFSLLHDLSLYICR